MKNNMINSFSSRIIFFIVMAVNLIFSQKMDKGLYFSVYEYDSISNKFTLNGEYGETIEIVNDSQFVYTYEDDITSKIGFGFYSFKGNLFTLFFSRMPSDYDTSSFKILKSNNSLTDSITYELILQSFSKIDQSYFTLWGASLKFISDVSTKVKTFTTDKKGRVFIKLCKCDLPGRILISY